MVWADPDDPSDFDCVDEDGTGWSSGDGGTGGSLGASGSTAEGGASGGASAGGAGGASAGEWVVDGTFAATKPYQTVSEFSLLYLQGVLRVLYKYTGQSEQPLYYGVRGVDGKWSASELDDDVEGRPALCQGPSGSLWIAFCVRSNVLGNVYGHVFGTPSHNGDFTVSQTINCADPSISAGPAPGQVHVATSNSFDNLRAVVRASDDYAETWSSVGTALSSYPAFNVVSQTKDDGTTMVAFVEDPDVEGPKSASLQVYEHVAGKWKAVGAGQPVHDYVFDFALDDGDVPYLAYNHATNGAVVARLAGGSWERLGEALDEKWSNDFALAFAAESVPYVAMVGSYEVGKVLRYADAIGWEALGAKGYFDADVAELDMVIGAGNVPFVAYTRTFASEEPLIIKYQQ